jgi:hypothetical protein
MRSDDEHFFCLVRACQNEATAKELLSTNKRNSFVPWCFSQRVLKEEDAFDAQCGR